MRNILFSEMASQRAFSRRKSPRDSGGFTVIELMIATIVFAVILLVVTAGVLQFTRQYYKGINSSNTQAAARAIIDDMTRAIQFNGGDINPLTYSGKPAGYCIGGYKRYSYVLG